REFSQPRWDGSDLTGRTILLHTEGGFGDALQFVRYTSLVQQRGGRVLLECQPELQALLGNVVGVDQIVVRGEPQPDFDVYCPLPSLPLIFGTTLATIPNTVPYLTADPERVEQWRARLATDGSRFRVGLVWSGSPKRLPRGKSPNCNLADFAPLAAVE